MVATVEDVCNLALDKIGYPERIANIYEGTKEANLALRVYGETRDELLREGEWPFSYQTAALTLLKGPPPPGGYNPTIPWSSSYPILPYLYEYAYPTNCLEFCAVTFPGAVLALPVLDPKPAPWRVAFDATLVTPAQVVLCNLNAAIGIYKARVTNPQLWNASFIGALVAALANKFVSLAPARQKTATQELQEATVLGAVGQRHRG